MLKKLLKVFGVILGLFFVLIIGAVVFSPDQEPESQNVFESQLDKYREAVRKAENSGNHIKIEALENEITHFLDEDRHVEFWYSQVKYVSNRDNGIAVKVSHRDQAFLLIITDPDLQDIATNLEGGDSVFFSGNLGREMSLTFSGGLEAPEYIITPTSVKFSLEGRVFTQ